MKAVFFVQYAFISEYIYIYTLTLYMSVHGVMIREVACNPTIAVAAICRLLKNIKLPLP